MIRDRFPLIWDVVRDSNHHLNPNPNLLETGSTGLVVVVNLIRFCMCTITLTLALPLTITITRTPTTTPTLAQPHHLDTGSTGLVVVNKNSQLFQRMQGKKDGNCNAHTPCKKSYCNRYMNTITHNCVI